MDDTDTTRFEAAALPHLDAAYRLARWIVRHDADAEDVVQEAYLRAFRFFDDVRAADARPWLLAIVRNTSYSWLERNRRAPAGSDPEAELEALQAREPSPEAQAVRADSAARLHVAIDGLRPEFREVVTLREIEGLSYKEIAAVTGSSLGTVMSRLSRARQRLYEALVETPEGEVRRGLR